MRSHLQPILLTVIASLLAGAATGAELRIAVAANFATTLEAIGTAFEHDGVHTVRISRGSTGKLYAQILNGAPFDIFFAADSERPRLLEERGIAVTGSRFSYATGRLVLWSRTDGLVDPAGAVLDSPRYRRLAIANPKLAPYGAAAVSVLEKRGLWPAISERVVRGENMGQTFQFVQSGNAELGFVARSQLAQLPSVGSQWLVPENLHEPIDQQAVLLTDTPAARAFAAFVRSQEGERIISAHGYDLPKPEKSHTQP